MPRHKPSHGSTAQPHIGRFDELLVQTVDAALAGCIFVVPFLLGGRHPLGQVVLVTLAVTAALAWIVRGALRSQTTWRFSGGELILLGGVLLLLLQIVPLSSGLLSWFAPESSHALSLWQPGSGQALQLGTWSRVSLTPADTQANLALFVAYGLLFLVTVQRIQTVDDVERLLRLGAWTAIAMAAFGVIQLLASNGKFFWFYEHVCTNTRHVAKGSFTNRNHFAHFLALGIGPLIWWIHSSGQETRPRRTRGFDQGPLAFLGLTSRGAWRIVALGIVLFAGLLTLSRGGSLVLFLATAIAATVCWRASARGMKPVVAIGAVALLIGVSLSLFGFDRVTDRMDDLTSFSIDTLDQSSGRRTIWKTVLKAIPDYAVLGAGAGSHREVYPAYLEWKADNQFFSHAENGYLQVALETGAPGLALLLGSLGLCSYWCIGGLQRGPGSDRSDRIFLCTGAVAAGLAASAVHSVVDFVWYVPACMAIVAVLAGMACRLSQLSRVENGNPIREVNLPRFASVMVAGGLVFCGVWLVGEGIGRAIATPHWEQFRKMEIAAAKQSPPGIQPWENPRAREEYRTLVSSEKRMIGHLEQTVRWNPSHARAHLSLARAYMRLFDAVQQTSTNAMSLTQISDAVVQSQSEQVPPDRRLDTRAKLEAWLATAIGDHYRYLDVARNHARQALALCPLHGEAYLYIAKLGFLEGLDAEAKAALIDQALEVRPFDGLVLFQAGNEAFLAGNPDRGLRYWYRSFKSGRSYQKQVIDSIAGRGPPERAAEEIEFLLEVFQPDLHALRLMGRRYREIPTIRPEQTAALRTAYAEAAEAEAEGAEGARAARLWLEAMGLYKSLNNPVRRLRCGENAMKYDPSNRWVRESFADCLADQGRWAEAEEHMRWLVRWNPSDETLERKLNALVRSRIEHNLPTANTGNSGRVR